MRDVATALGLVLVIEGIAYAAWPNLLRRALEAEQALGRRRTQVMALAIAAAGVGVLALARA